MEVDAPRSLDTVQVDGGVSGENQRLVGGRDVHHLHDSGVDVRLDEDFVAFWYQVPRQPHNRRWSRSGGRYGWRTRHIHVTDLDLVHGYHGDHAGDGRDRQDRKGNGETLGQDAFSRHRGSFLWSAPKGWLEMILVTNLPVNCRHPRYLSLLNRAWSGLSINSGTAKGAKSKG